MNDLDRILQLAGLSPLYEGVAGNFLNMRHDLIVPIPGMSKPLRINSAVEEMRSVISWRLHRREVEHSTSTAIVKWFSTTVIKWIANNHASMPIYALTGFDDYIEFLLDTNEEIPHTTTEEEVRSAFPEWAENSFVFFPTGAETFLEFSQDEAEQLFDCDHVMDYFIVKVPEGLKLDRLSVSDAVAKAEAWNMEKLKGAEDDSVTVMAFPDGMKMVRITTVRGLDYESEQCKHCIGRGGYDAYIKSGTGQFYSLRDQDNAPKVTIFVKGEVVQEIQGPGNTPPAPEYIRHIGDFCRKHNINIPEKVARRTF